MTKVGKVLQLVPWKSFQVSCPNLLHFDWTWNDASSSDILVINFFKGTQWCRAKFCSVNIHSDIEKQGSLKGVNIMGIIDPRSCKKMLKLASWLF